MAEGDPVPVLVLPIREAEADGVVPRLELAPTRLDLDGSEADETAGDADENI